MRTTERVSTLNIDDENNDWCMKEEIVTEWAGDVCLSCGRIWGAAC